MRAGCVALMWCGYPRSVSLPHEAVCQFAVIDCDSSWYCSFVERRGLLAIQAASILYKYMSKMFYTMHEI